MQISSNSIAEERSVVLPSKDMYGSPMTSTPFADHRSKRTNLHDLSRECASISAIAVLPERMPSARAQYSSTRTVENKRVAFLEPKTNMNSISPIIRQNTLLSSSAIDRALSESRVVSMNDSQLIAALNNARKRTEHLTFKVPDLIGSNSQGNAISSTRNIYKHRERVGMEPLRSNNQIENIHQSNGGNMWNGDAGVQERENIPTAVEVRGIECGELQQSGSVMLKRREDYCLHVTFKPNTAAFFKSAICIVVRNVERISYSIPVRGAGGTAILILRDQGHDISRMKDGSFVLTTSHPISVPIEIKNVGVRDAFAVISVLDSTTKKRIDRVNILPSDKAVILRRQKMKFEIKIDEKELEEARNRVDTTAATFGSTSALCGRSNYVIRVIWAEELLRYRLKRAEEELGREWKVDEISFTRGVFANEEKAKLATAACSAPYNVADRDTFECHLRVMTISVADNRRFIVRQQPQRQTQHDDAQVVVLEPDATLTAPDATTAIIQDVTLVPHK
ncbi:unnamed protein product [Anisakis simplex]|uniref:Spindle-defective protein 2 (inferred by orthology to a C. elegans protein) n=1 Tax=Anisakis simplex TaxID=6269 RepID=A0A0M3JVU0_ANISI|nr:unnamed protein product [Anisakis simplex]